MPTCMSYTQSCDHLNHFFSATSIKSQVCEAVQVIRTSLYQIHALFYCDNDSGEKEFQGQMFSHYHIDNLASFYIHFLNTLFCRLLLDDFQKINLVRSFSFLL